MPLNEILTRVRIELVAPCVQFPVLLPGGLLQRVVRVFPIDFSHCLLLAESTAPFRAANVRERSPLTQVAAPRAPLPVPMPCIPATPDTPARRKGASAVGPGLF